MPAEAHQVVERSRLDSGDVEDFIDKVAEASRLINGLKAGTISVDYVDSKLAASCGPKDTATATKGYGATEHISSSKPQQNIPGGREVPEAEQQADLQKKVAELKASRQRKQKVRQLFQQHTEQHKQDHATDYTKWDLFCPSDEEDDMVNSITPNTPQFKALERDINDRHNRMVEQRQIAERQRQLGNEAFKAKQYSEALRCYELGLESQQHNMALHANAAQAALKLHCYVQALEHCDKVLHLAQALYNNPKDPLCVKALQRRAAAYQAMEQHSKAVEDLKAAAAIAPGDKEVLRQLQRADRLLDEYRTAKKLRGAAAAASDADAVDKPSPTTNVQLSTLRRIEQLVGMLDIVGDGQQHQAAASDVVDICHELLGLVSQASSSCLYFRECGGLAAAIRQVLRPLNSDTLTAALQLLTAVCDSPTTTEQLAQQQQLLASAADQITASHTAVSAAAVELLYTVSKAAPVRRELGKQLLAKRTAGGCAAVAANDSGCSRLESLWTVCGNAATHPTAAQALAVTLLSNCLLEPAVKEATRQLLAQKPQLLDQLVNGVDCGSKSVRSAAQEQLFGLLSNLCTHAALRQQLAAHERLLRCAVAAAVPIQAKEASGVAALALLCNLSLETQAQQQLARDSQVMGTLLTWASRAPAAIDTYARTSKSNTVKVGPRLPDRKRLGSEGKQHSHMQQATTVDMQWLQRQRAACLLSRAVKQPEGIKTLLGNNGLGGLLGCLSDRLQELKQTKQNQNQQLQNADDSDASKAAWTEAVVRIIAVLTAQPGTCSSCGPEQAAAAIKVCLDLLQFPLAGEATKGNSALCLGHFAAESCWHDQLHQADAVKTLVDIAYAGKGNGSSKNAAIALAKMATDERMLERLRVLHGLEIIYQYVRV